MCHASTQCVLFSVSFKNVKKQSYLFFFAAQAQHAKNALMSGSGGGFQSVWWMCSSLYLHVCACVLGNKSLMWVMDSPGVSMMSRRRPPRSSAKVGPISHSLSDNDLYISFPTLPFAS